MAVSVIVGLQWGDEGKGKIVDGLVGQKGYGLVARFQGGPNAGHTIHRAGKPCVLHQIPSGIFHPKTLNLLGNGVVIDAAMLQNEIALLKGLGMAERQLRARIILAQGAHLILPDHVAADRAEEKKRGAHRLGTTLRGVGPCYQDKVGRRGLRISDIKKTKDSRIREEDKKSILGFPLVDAVPFLREHIARGTKILAEGAQGTLLDNDHGTYPYVTSSNTISGQACTGLGVAPRDIGKVYGVSKVYCTRVGEGPFPSEGAPEEVRRIRSTGKEFGATTERPRRCGWLDLPALHYAVSINGADEIFLTKADVLNGFASVKVCVRYEHKNGAPLSAFSPYMDFSAIKPIFKTFAGWHISEHKAYASQSELPETLRAFIQFIDENVGAKVVGLSYGPGREQTLFF